MRINKLGTKFVSFLMSLIIVSGMVCVPASADTFENETNVSSEELFEAGNSFSKMLAASASEYETEDNEQTEPLAGFGIGGVSVDGHIAAVSYTAAFDCRIVVGIYSEDGVMAASGRADAPAAEESSLINVTIDVGSLPEYFIVKVFLLDKMHNPMCACFKSTEYTESIQIVKRSDINDYSSERTINLDESEKTNFVVCNEDVIKIEGTENKNVPENTMPDDNVFVFDNCDEAFKGLKAGDHVAYVCNDDIILIDVDKINVDGDKVTISADPSAKTEDFFDVVKIEETSNMENVSYDGSDAYPGVTYEGTAAESSGVGGLYPSGVSAELKAFNIGIDTTLKTGEQLKAKLSVSVKVTIELYIHWGDSYFKEETQTTLKGSASLSGKTTRVSISLGDILDPFSSKFIKIDYTPKFVIETGMQLSAEFTISSKNGFVIDKNGFRHYSESGKNTLEAEAAGTLFIGIDFGPEIQVFKGSALDLKMDFTVGGNAEVSYELYNKDKTKKHLCNVCFSITTDVVIEIGASFKMFGWVREGTSGKLTLYKKKYYDSIDNDEFGEGDCPNCEYRTDLEIQIDGNPAGNKEIFITPKDGERFNAGTTDNSGKLSLFLGSGTYYIGITENSAESGLLVIEDDAKTRKFNFKTINVTAEKSGTPITNAEVSFKMKMDADIFGILDFAPVGVTDSFGKCRFYTPYKEGTVVVNGISKEFSSETSPVEVNITEDGKCGDNLFWNFNEDTYTLTIYGEGSMYDYSWNGGDGKEFSPWYDDRTLIDYIVIESGVTNIGTNAFASCTSLESMEIPDNIKIIGGGAFHDCTNLKTLKINAGTREIHEYAFSGCVSLSNVSIASGVTSVGNNAFQDCAGLYTLELPDSVREIGEDAFAGCSSLLTFRVPRKVSVIEWNVFGGCNGLVSLQIPVSVNKIAESFYFDLNIQDIFYEGSEQQWSKIDMFGRTGCITCSILHSDPSIHYNSTLPTSDDSTEKTDVESSGAAETKYTGLVPYGYYIFMLVKDKNAEDILVSENLVYIDQFTADDNGVVSPEYPDFYGTNYEEIFVGGAAVEDPAVFDDTTDSDTESETDTQTDTDAQTETDTQTDTDTQTETDTQIDTDTQTETDTQIDTDVKPAEKTAVTLNYSSLELTIGETAVLEAVITPESARDQDINWFISDETVIRVFNGTVIGLKAGESIITVITTDGAFARCTVTVKAKEPEKIMGDLDGDTQITSADALVILRMSVGAEEVNLTLADVDGDGMITSADALAVLRASVGSGDSGNIGKPIS